MLRKGLFTLLAYISAVLLATIFVIAAFLRTPVLLRASYANTYLFVFFGVTAVFCGFCLLRKSRVHLAPPVFLAVLLALVVIPRLLWVLLMDTVPSSDFKHMHDFGAAASQGVFDRYVAFYALFPFKFNFGFILAGLYRLFGVQVLAVKLFNVLLSGLAALLMWRIGKLVFDERTGRTAALLFAVWPAQILYCSVVAAEHVFLVFFLLAVFLFLRFHSVGKGGKAMGGLAASGFFLALAQLVRPVATLLLAVWALYLLFFVRYRNERLADWLRKAKVLAIIITAFLLTLTAVSWPVSKLTGVPSARSSSGFNLLIGTNNKANGMFNKEDFSIIEEFQYDYEKVHSEATKRALDRIRSNPAGFVKLAVRKFTVLWGDEHYGYYWSTSEANGVGKIGELLKNSPRKLAAAAQLHYFILLLFAAAGCVIARRRLVYPVVTFLLAFGGFIAAYTFLEVQTRYHIPVIPFLMLLAAFGLEQLASPILQKLQEARATGRAGKGGNQRPVWAKRAVVLTLSLITAYAILLRIDCFIPYMKSFTLYGDAQNYHIMSQQLVDKGVFGYGFNGKLSRWPNAFITPGYPLFLSAIYAVFHDKYLLMTLARLAQVFIGGLTPLLGYLFLSRLFKRRDVGIVTALFMAVYPTYIQSSVHLLTEIWSLATMLLYFYVTTVALQERKVWLNVLAGVSFAVHILFRPAMLPLFVLPYILLYFTEYKKERKTLVRFFTLSVAGFAAVMLPWWVRNLVTLHKLILTATGSGNPLLAGTYPYMVDLFKDCGREIMESGDKQAQYAKVRILRGFTTEPLLYLKWYTLGKIQFMFGEPWLYKMNLHYQPFHTFFHTLFVWGGLVGVVINSIRDKVSRYVNLYGLIFLGLYLVFIPVNRYTYQLLFFLMAALALLLCDLAKWVWFRWGLRGKKA